jgi:hypothetical protein
MLQFMLGGMLPFMFSLRIQDLIPKRRGRVVFLVRRGHVDGSGKELTLNSEFRLIEGGLMIGSWPPKQGESSR